MKFSDLFIKKPVLAIVVSLLILVLGLRSVSELTVRQYPKTENAVVTVSTNATMPAPTRVPALRCTMRTHDACGSGCSTASVVSGTQ